MKETTSTIENAALGSLCGQVATYTKVNIKMTNEMATEKCIGRMAVVTRVNGCVAFSMAMAE